MSLLLCWVALRAFYGHLVIYDFQSLQWWHLSPFWFTNEGLKHRGLLTCSRSPLITDDYGRWIQSLISGRVGPLKYRATCHMCYLVNMLCIHSAIAGVQLVWGHSGPQALHVHLILNWKDNLGHFACSAWLSSTSSVHLENNGADLLVALLDLKPLHSSPFL